MVNLTIVIPLYNGLKHIEPMLEKLVPMLNILELEWEIIFIDDHSTDLGFEFISKNTIDNNNIRCIRLKENVGQQNALFCGLVNAKGDLIITMDDDLQHPVDIIPELIQTINQGFDVVYAVNRSPNRSNLLRLGTWFNGLFFTMFLKKPRSIEIGSYRIMKRSLVDSFKDVNNKFIYVSALIFSSKDVVRGTSFLYTPSKITSANKSRFNMLSRFKLFIRLFNNYGPLSMITKEKGIPYVIESKI